MEKGTQPKLTVSDDDKNYSYYHAICGEHKTGKTTLIRKIVNKIEQDKVIQFYFKWKRVMDVFMSTSEVYKDYTKNGAVENNYVAVFVTIHSVWSHAENPIEIEAEFLKDDKYYKTGKSVISVLLNFKEVSYIVFEEFFNNYRESNKVLEKNIFAYHPERNTVTFQLYLVECYIQDNADIFIK
ncbi:9079_t:CDS:2 [Diversispora eburnea]|uniref:9079_t:CDS:1 n=1 Tax=Diversispora eburnea TaxID=1213867 RepID=A0A9N8ZZQ4_9GLOM|nr:9079_t:CDS:2 [Diversispora eburnea]